MDYSITQFGKPLSKSKYVINEMTKVFSSNENNLVLDYGGFDFWTFNTGSGCTFKTGYSCAFNTGGNCTFDTGDNCIFDTGHECIFKTVSGCTFGTRHNCTFNTGDNCTFDTGCNCIFKTGYNCTFNTGHDCTFDSKFSCTFDVGYNCTFKTGKNCVIVRRDIFEIITIPENKTIKLNDFNIKGYEIITESKEETIEIDGKVISVSTIKEALKSYFK